MNQRRRNMRLLNGAMNIFGAAAANAINEVRVVVARSFAGGSGFGLIGNPRLIRVVSVDGEIAVRSVKNVANGVSFGIHWSQRLWLLSRLLGCGGIQSRGGHTGCSISAGANLRLMIGDPVAHFEFHQLALGAWSFETEGRVQRVGRLLVVLKHEVSAHRRHMDWESDSQAPARDINLMDGLIADLPVSRVPNPMPVVVKAILGERLQRRRAGPQVVMHSSRHGLFDSVPDRWPPFIAERARQIDVSDCPVAQMTNSFDHPGIRSRLASMLANPAVLLYRAHQLMSLEPVVRARLFH